MRECDCGIHNPTWAHMAWHARRQREIEREREREIEQQEWLDRLRRSSQPK